jgi:D-alanine-D-alanine ligase
VSGPLRVAVAYNEPALPREHPDYASEADVVDVATAVANALSETGFASELLSVGPPLVNVLTRLQQSPPDLVFNLVEGFAGRSAGATYFPALLELLRLPYTGSPVEALSACVSKERAKALLRGHGLPTARSRLLAKHESVPMIDFDGPWIVKPDDEDGSLGIDQSSVVFDRDALMDRVERLRQTHAGGILIESYLPGPEFNVGLTAFPEPRALPIAQVVYHTLPGLWPILTYAAKWDPGSIEDKASVVHCPASIDPDLADRLASLAISAYRATSCRDYARVDLRLDAEGEPMILEVNPNPDIGPTAGWARAVRVSGGNYAEAIASVARQALAR